MDNLLQTALQYQAAGFSIVPVRSDKTSVGAWKHLQERRLSPPELRRVFGQPDVAGIAIVCGTISKGFEAIDLDDKHDLTGQLSATYFHQLQAEPNIWNKLVIASTKNNGHHLYYRCEEPGPSTILARRPATAAEKLSSPEIQALTLAERRGQGSYVIVPPSMGYRLVQRDLLQLAHLSMNERKHLSDLAASFNQWQAAREGRIIIRPPNTWQSQNPLDDYNQRGDPLTLLVNHGWKIAGHKGPRIFLQRAGKTDHRSSGDYHQVLRLLTVFTPNTLFTPYKGYSPAAIFAVLECQGSFTLAAKQLIDLGYGIAYKKRR